MKKILLLVAIAVAGVIGLSALPQSSSAATGPANWPPLSETCNDITGDGQVDLFGDIVGVIDHYGAKWGDDDYALVFDVSGGGVVDLFNDIVGVIDSYGTTCSLVDTQLVRSAISLLKYKDCQDAVADGYSSTGVYVGNMGIHISKASNLKSTFDPNLWDQDAEDLHQADELPGVGGWVDLANPFGLVCSEHPDNFNQPDVLMGPWYIIPVASTGFIYGVTGIQPNDVPPVGYDTDEDYIAYNPESPGAQAGWHTHINLCVGANPAFLAENGSGPWNNSSGHGAGAHTDTDPQHQCTQHTQTGGFINIPLYGWMLHLYNFAPNPDGRFMRWNVNPDFPRCGHAPNTGGPC